MTKVLVTGASGLLGRRVVAELRHRGADVTATSRSGAAGSTVADLTSAEATQDLVRVVQPDVVVHLAGGQAQAPDVYAVNVLPTVHLLDALISSTLGVRVIVCGSAAEYGEGGGTPLAETALCVPVNDYGRAKLAQTSVARAVARAQGLEVLIVRPFNVVAPDMPPSSALGNVRRQLREGGGRGRRVTCGRTDVRRDFVVADDVASVLVEFIEDWPGVPMVNLCSGTGVALGDVVAGLAAELDVEVDLHVDPVLAALPAADSVVGHAGLLTALGLRLDGSIAAVVKALAADNPA